MNNWPVLALIIDVAILAVLAAVIAIYIKSKNRDEQTETDYRFFYPWNLVRADRHCNR